MTGWNLGAAIGAAGIIRHSTPIAEFVPDQLCPHRNSKRAAALLFSWTVGWSLRSHYRGRR